MPFQPMNFANIPLIRMPDVVGSLAQGYQAGLLPEMEKREQQKEIRAENADARAAEAAKLANAFKQMQMQQYPEQQRLSNLLTQSRISELQRKAQDPFGGQIAPGEIGQAMWLERIKNIAGEDSPFFKRAQDAFNREQQAKQGLVDYRSALTGTADKRYSTQTGKRLQEQSDIDAGFMPGTGRTVPIAPEQQKKFADEYALKGLKEVTDTNFRNKAAFARNIDKTIESIDIDALTRYAGAPGQVKLIMESLAAPFGMESKDYQDYQQAMKGAQLLAKQIRQFYGDSIQPNMVEKIENMTSPATWRNNPELAKNSFNTLADILKKETKTYTGSLKSSKQLLEGGSTEKEKESLPKFQSKEEFRRYLSNLTPQQRQILKQRMFGGK